MGFDNFSTAKNETIEKISPTAKHTLGPTNQIVARLAATDEMTRSPLLSPFGHIVGILKALSPNSPRICGRCGDEKLMRRHLFSIELEMVLRW
jgi:hypothetical protein